jgi:hypothetical protein
MNGLSLRDLASSVAAEESIISYFRFLAPRFAPASSEKAEPACHSAGC